MNNINYTAYKSEPDEYIAYFGKAYLQKGYAFVNGDETFYHFIGNNSCFSILDLLHPDDVEGFKEAVNLLKKERQCIIVRMRDANDKYRLLYMELWLNGQIKDGFECITIEFSNLMEVKNKYIVYSKIINKYRSFMSLSEKLFFEYAYDKDEFLIYHYVGLISKVIFKRNFTEVNKEIEESTEYSQTEKNEFKVLCDYIKKGVDRFKVSVSERLLSGEGGGRYDIKATTMFEEGNRSMCVGVISVSDRINEKKSYYLSDSAIDPGTGIWNKRAIQEYALEKTLEEKEFYVGIIDIDDFKKINDGYGHMFGDEVILKVSEIVRGVVNTRGMLGRFGGDEFVIVFDGVTKEESLRRILKTISKNLQWEYQNIKGEIAITTSCGVAKFPNDGSTFEEVFDKADKALYIAKAKGKNRFIIYEEEKHKVIVNEEAGEHSIGIKSIASDEKKAMVMSDAVLLLHSVGTKALNEVIEKMRSHFDIDGVSIYNGQGMNRVLSVGKYINPIEHLSWVRDTSYIDFFDTQGMYIEGNIKRLSSHYEEAYNKYELQETKKFIQCVAYRDGKPAAVVSFDYFNRAPKIGATDLGLITIVGRLMADVACGLE